MKPEQSGNNLEIFCGFDITRLQLLGEGRQGRVYIISEEKVIKVFKNKESLKNQLVILQHSAGSRFFPKFYEHDDSSIVLEFIKGTSLNKHLKIKGMSKIVSLELVELINEFKHLGFTRLDIRISHIFLQEDESIRIIDPRGSFRIIQPYPNLMLRGLRELGALEKFFEFIKEDHRDVYDEWKLRWEEYANKNVSHS